MGRPTAAQLRSSAAIRVGAAVLIAGAITTIAIVASWGPLDVSTDIVGYPTFYDFNVENYFTGYYLVVGFFPIAALLLFLGLTRIGPRIGLPVPSSRGALRPSTPAPEATSALEGEPPLALAPAAKRRMVVGARIAFVGAVLGLEAGIAADAIWLGLSLGLAIYALAVLLVAALADRWGPRDYSLEQHLAALNSLGAPLTVAGLIAVSAATEVRILADGSQRSYPWFSAWLGVPAAAALVAWVAVALRKSRSAAAVAGIERRALVLITAPVCLFVLLAALPGDQGPIDLFHTGERLVSGRLVGDGWLPWRDVVLTHGLLVDVVNPQVGFAVFGDSHWGSVAGITVLTSPLFFVSLYFLFVYLFGRNWPFLLLTGVLVLGTALVPMNFRFILWPLILLLLAAVIDRPRPLRSAGLALLAVGQTIITPESAPTLLAVAVVLVAYELYDRDPGASIVSSFPRTIWFAATGAATAALFAAYLASRGALDDYVYVSINLVRGLPLTGGKPPTHVDVSEALYRFMALTPIAAMLIAFAYAVVRLRLRLRFRTEDWVMAAVAFSTLVYYRKFLGRMDVGHVAEPYALALPLLLFIVYRAVETVEQASRNARVGRLIGRATAHPVSLALVVLVAVLGSDRLNDRISDAAVHYRPAAASEPKFKRVGFAELDPVLYRDLKRVIGAYLRPGERLFDFTNEPALFFYLLDRDPSTRYFQVTLAGSEELQADLIDRLRKARPKLIVYDDAVPLGLSSFDGIPTMVRNYDVSRWILDHYRPLLTTHAHTFYARRDQPGPEQLDLGLTETPVTEGVEFQTQRCNWGFAPNFLNADQPGDEAGAVSAKLRRPRQQLITITGWAGDVRAEAPARKVVVVHGGRIVASTTPDVLRPELTATGVPGFARAGYQFSIPAARLRETPGPGGVRLFAIAADGAVAELGKLGAPGGSQTVRLGGRSVRLRPAAISGSIDRVRRAPALEIVIPPGMRWSDFDWLQLEARRAFERGRYFLYDNQRIVDARREISFGTLDRSPRRYLVPVGNCAQWRGYRGRRLYLSLSRHQGIAGARLIQ